MADDLWQRSACELAEGIALRTFSCRDVMASVASRIRARNGALNAIVYDYTEEAMAEARHADEELAAGRVRGPLHGVPVTIKENVDQQGKPTPNGLPAFEKIIAPDDAPVVRNLKKAGAIVVGRTNTPELSMRATTDNPLHGRTRNPWHPDASPGGSSGGAGAAAAAGFGPIHHGNDIGGSLRFPAFACGLATVKPTPGRIAAYNPSATAEREMLAQLMSVQGAICREVRDVRLATRVMAQPDPRDPWWVPAPFDGEPLPTPIRVAYERMANAVDAAGYMLGIAERTRMTRQWSVFLDRHPLVLTPFLMRPTFPWDYDARGFEQPRDLFDSAIYSFGINYLGLPAGVVPVGLVEGLPAGIQIVGGRFREDLVLDAMAVVERHVGVLARTLWQRES